MKRGGAPHHSAPSLCTTIADTHGTPAALPRRPCVRADQPGRSAAEPDQPLLASRQGIQLCAAQAARRHIGHRRRVGDSRSRLVLHRGECVRSDRAAALQRLPLCRGRWGVSTGGRERWGSIQVEEALAMCAKARRRGDTTLYRVLTVYIYGGRVELFIV